MTWVEVIRQRGFKLPGSLLNAVSTDEEAS